VPWNWPFHNIINPISAAVMSGNAIVIKVGDVLGRSQSSRWGGGVPMSQFKPLLAKSSY
jgi:hypothetical protein